MYGVYEQSSPRVAKRRVMADLAFASIPEAVAHFTAAGGYAEADADHDAADVFTKGGIVLTVEPLKENA